MVDPVSGARGIIRDTCADGAYRFHWSIIPSQESLPIAAGRPEGFARAADQRRSAQGHAEDFRMHNKVTRADPPTLDAHPGS